jgi:hypothetical protein
VSKDFTGCTWVPCGICVVPLTVAAYGSSRLSRWAVVGHEAAREGVLPRVLEEWRPLLQT